MSAAVLWVIQHRKLILRVVLVWFAAVFTLAVLGIVLILGISSDEANTASASTGCLPGLSGPAGDLSSVYQGIGLSGSQVDQAAADAAAIIAQGNADAVPPRGWTIAVATSIQEARLLNLNYGDRDSVGLFQQRTGWGPLSVRMDPRGSAHMFYTGGQQGQPGLLDISGWQSMSLTAAAQAVQRSGFPLAYAQWESAAQQIVAATGVDPGAACQVGAAGPWTPPIAGHYTLTSGFGMRVHPITGALRMHTGQDMAAPIGTPVLAASAGTVVRADARDAGGYGNLVVVQHADGIQTYYAHLSVIAVTPGQAVAEGQPVGAVGQTGAATGPHLHFEVRVNEVPIDPIPWMTQHGAPLEG